MIATHEALRGVNAVPGHHPDLSIPLRRIAGLIQQTRMSGRNEPGGV
jgi:hypothetical protein